jgi:hypothetical protein
MVGRVNAFLELAAAFLPGLVRAFRSAGIFAHSHGETRIAEWLYQEIAPADFSRQVLSPGVAWLITVALGEVDWNDLGDPNRVISTLFLKADAESLAGPNAGELKWVQSEALPTARRWRWRKRAQWVQEMQTL